MLAWLCCCHQLALMQAARYGLIAISHMHPIPVLGSTKHFKKAFPVYSIPEGSRAREDAERS